MQAIDPIFGEVTFDHGGRDPRQAILRILPWGIALAFAACMVRWVPHSYTPAAPDLVVAHPAARVPVAVAAVAPAPVEKASNPYGELVSLNTPLANPYGQLVDLFHDAKPAPDTKPAAPSPDTLQASLETTAPSSAGPNAGPQIAPPTKRDVAGLDEAAPLPPPRPSWLGPAARLVRRAPQPNDKVAAETAPAPDDRNIFEKLFGVARPSNGAVVAYAEPESHAAGPTRSAALAATDHSSGFSFFGKSTPPSGYDQWTAVYDISARTVYLPDGTRLEAHSGLGDRLDDPRYVNERGRGATPPDIYDLTPREQLFHGVQALRLTPVGDGDVFGRAGLLAHTYMLGPNGDSNGCVSFKDYDTFLRAYQEGRIKRLAVVSRL